VLLDSLLEDVAVTVPSAATEVEVDSEAEAVVEASAETLVEVVAVVALASAAGVSWAMEISGATPRAATKPAAAMMRTEAFMGNYFLCRGGITWVDGVLYNFIQNLDRRSFSSGEGLLSTSVKIL
jgi:hypothetical protein